MSVRRIVRLALFTAVALIMSLVESALPPLLAFAPGAKMGLSNVVTVLAFILLGYSDAYIVLVLRCVLGSVFGGNIAALMYSLPAGLISLTVQILLYRFLFPKVSLMGISFCGAVLHNVVQITVACLIASTNLFALLPLMLLASVIAGLFVGIVAYFVIRYLPKSVYASGRSVKG